MAGSKIKTMKRIVMLCLLSVLLVNAKAQFSVRYDASIQPTGNMQYFKPVGNNLFVGDGSAPKIVPEPATLLLLGSTFAGVDLASWRKRQRRG